MEDFPLKEKLKTQPAASAGYRSSQRKLQIEDATPHLVTKTYELESTEDHLHYAVGSRPVTKLAQ